MITVLLNTDWPEVRPFRYDTNSFDEAAKMLVDDWVAGKVVWETEELRDAFTPEWLNENGYPTDECEPQIHTATGIVTYVWHWCGDTESDDLIVYGYFIKSAPVEDHEWPTLGICTGMTALPDAP